MTLREKIEDIILDNCPASRGDFGEPGMAAMEILKYLNEQLDLDGNGWFDDDKEMIEFLGY